MTTLTLFLHYGPSDHGGWHPGFFLFGPGIFWLDLLGLLVAMKLSRHTRPAPGRHREGEGHGPDPAARPYRPVDDTGSGPTWPDLDPEPRPQPRPEQQGRDIEIF
jgi:hypothetical protein